MARKKEKKLKLPVKRIISDNWFMLKLVHRASPGFLTIEILLSIVFAGVSFISNTYMLRYALNSINEGRAFYEIALVLIFWLAIQLIDTGVRALYYARFYEIRSNEVSRFIHTMAYKKAMQVELECYENPKYYDKFVKAIDECGGRAIAVMDAVTNAIYRIIFFIANFSLVVIIDPILLLFLLLPLVAVPIQSKLNKISYRKNMEQKEENRRKDYARRTFYLADYAKEMRMTAMPELMLARFRESGGRVIGIIKQYGFSLATLNYIMTECNEVLSALGATFYSVWRTLGDGSMGYGDCIVIVNSIESIAYTLTNSANMLLKFQDNALYIENLREFLDHEPTIKSGLLPLPPGGDLVLNHVSFRYDGAAEYALRDVSMRLGQNEKIAIVGHNGAGKTTLVKLLLRLYDAEGSITYGGRDIKEFSLDTYRDMYAAVMQDLHIFALTVAENVMLRPLREEDSETVNVALRQSGLHEKVTTFPNKENTIMTREFDESGEQMSGGEQQKLAIAHVYSKPNRFVILDEPSSALDPIAEHEMYQRMNEACKNCGMIFISHRLSSAVMADRIYLMEKGQVIESGTHAQLMAQNGRYAEMFRRQAENYAEVEV